MSKPVTPLWLKIVSKVETFPLQVDLLDYTSAIFTSAEWPDIPALYQCWIWKGAKVNKFGTRLKMDRQVFGGKFLANTLTEYPVMAVAGSTIRAQFAAWIAVYGYRPSGLRHAGCENPLCINPIHWAEIEKRPRNRRIQASMIEEDVPDEAFIEFERAPAPAPPPTQAIVPELGMSADDYQDLKEYVLEKLALLRPPSLEEFLTMPGIDDEDPAIIERILRDDRVALAGL